MYILHSLVIFIHLFFPCAYSTSFLNTKNIKLQHKNVREIKHQKNIYHHYKIIRCFKCNSAEHFARYCTIFSCGNDIYTVVDSDQVYFYLFNVNSPYRTLINDSNIISSLMKDMRGRAILDFECSQTVVGEIFLNVFSDTLNILDKQFVETAKSNKIFCFGNWGEVKSF